MSYRTFIEFEKEESLQGFRERMKSIQVIAGLNTDEMARCLDISRGNYQKYLNGGAKMPVDKILYLASEFKVDGNYLLTGDSSAGIMRYKEEGESQAFATEIREVQTRAEIMKGSFDREAKEAFRDLIHTGIDLMYRGEL